MDDTKKDLMGKIGSAKQHLAMELGSIRTGRANPALLDTVAVDVYGQKMAIKDIATITVPDPQQILIQPWDKVNTGPLEKSITDANLGFGVTNEGDKIRVSVPLLSAERREELVKFAQKMNETTKVSIRGARRDAMDALDKRAKEGGVSDDDKERLKKEYQALIDTATNEVDTTTDKKATELRSI